MNKAERITPKVGQVWADNDPRMAGRTLKIIAIDGERVQFEVIENDQEAQRNVDDGFLRSDRRGKKSWVKAARLIPTMTGYRFIKEEA